MSAQKTSPNKKPLIIGVSVVAGFFILLAVASALLPDGLGTLTRGFFETGSAQYRDDAQQAVDAPKTFSADETAEIGPYDVVVKRIDQTYKTSVEDGTGSYRKERDERWVRVDLTVTYNQARGELYDGLRTSIDDWFDAIIDLRMNDAAGSYGRWTVDERQAAQETLKQGGPLEVTRVYALPTADTPEYLIGRAYVFTKVSYFVGTEGMPSATLEYKITTP